MIRSFYQLVVFLLVGLLGCSVNKTSTRPVPQSVDFEGVAQAGRIMFGVVRVYGLVLGKRGALLAETVTDPQGKYRFRMAPYNGPIEVVVTGGPNTTYLDEASGETIKMRTGDSLTTVVPTGAIPGIYPVTPITHIAAEVAKTTIAASGEVDTQAISRSIALAKEKVATMFDTTPDVIDAIPSDPGSKVDANSREGKAAQKLATLSQLIKNAGKQSEPFEGLKSLVEDGKDGQMDGKAFGTALTETATALTQNFSTSLKTAETDFLKSESAVAKNFEDFKSSLVEEDPSPDTSTSSGSSSNSSDVVEIIKVGETTRDTKPPVLVSITFPSNPVAGATGSVTVEMTDDRSGVAYFNGRLVPDFENGGNAVINFSGYFGWEGTTNSGNNSYSVEFDVGKYFAPGIYRLESFSASDRAGNYISLSGNQGDITYSGTTIPVVKVTVENHGAFDITAPTLGSITFPSAPVAGTGGKVTIEVSDDVSGVASFYGQLVPDFEDGGHAAINFWGSVGNSGPSYGIFGYMGETTDLGNNTYTVDFSVNEFFPPGVYRLGSFSVTDNAGYTTSYYAGKDQTTYSNSTKPVVKVNVENPGASDITGPTLVGLTFPEPPMAGTKGIVNVEVSDNVSGVASFSGRLVPDFDNGGNASISFYGTVGGSNTLDLGNNTYAVEFEVGEFFPPGDYRLESFEAYDKAGYQTSYWAARGTSLYENTTKPVLKVKVENARSFDVTGPTLSSITFPTSLNAGTKGQVSVVVSDNVSGVVAFHGRLVPESGDSGATIDFYGSVEPDSYYYFWGGSGTTTALGNNTYSVEFDVSESVSSGVYRLELFEAYDKARNFVSYSAGPGDATYSNSQLPVTKVDVIGKAEEVEISGGTNSFNP